MQGIKPVASGDVCDWIRYLFESVQNLNFMLSIQTKANLWPQSANLFADFYSRWLADFKTSLKMFLKCSVRTTLDKNLKFQFINRAGFFVVINEIWKNCFFTDFIFKFHELKHKNHVFYKLTPIPHIPDSIKQILFECPTW